MKIASLFGTTLFLGLAISQTACATELILDVHARKVIDRATLVQRIADAEELVVGEQHYAKSVQNAEAALFADYAKARGEKITFAWEFWDWKDQAKIEDAYSRFAKGDLTGEAFVRSLFGANSQMEYLPLLEAVKAAGADVLATNLSRAEKAPVVKDGLKALDPALLPADYETGSPEYLARFQEAMGGHGGPALQNYFDAQCLVDNVVAEHFAKDRKTPSAFLVIGSFHTRYYDGVWKQIEKRSSSKKRVLIEIGEAAAENDWGAVLTHAKYGSVSDYFILTD